MHISALLPTRKLLLGVAVTAASLGLATTGGAQTYNTAFGGAGYTCVNVSIASCAATKSGRPVSYIWHGGDYWQQSISGSGLASISQLSISLNMDNALNMPNTLTFAVMVNGTTVGNTATFSNNGFLDITAPYTFNFAAISAAVYDVRVQVVPPTVPDGGGSLGLYTDGQSTIQLAVGTSTTVPEPATYALMSAGLLVVGAAARRRRNNA